VLYERINRRADHMIERGLVDEVRGLIESGVPVDAKAFSAHGYRRIVEYLRGERSLEDAIEQMKLDTRHYAKRQWTWWRRQPNTHWLAGFGHDESVIDEAKQIIATVDRSEDPRELTE
jgi:tRNA dimethylallyltransferase